MDVYRAPDFSRPELVAAPDARFALAPADGVLPEGFFSTTNLPTYVKHGGAWTLPRTPRMDSAIVIEADAGLRILEGRYVRAGQSVAVGEAEDGSQGILVNTTAFQPEPGSEGEFSFMSSAVSREKPVDYVQIAELLHEERARGGHIVWLLGPAVLHARGRETMAWFVENGYVGALLGGNAIAVHDIEQAMLGTTLGMDRWGRPVQGGHAYHMRVINQVRAAGSIAAAVERGLITNGIMHACVRRGVPFVLAGSIRDDGPLPDTIPDSLRAQEVMRAHAERCTLAIMIATALHSIAFGNMLPAYTIDVATGQPRPIPTVAVDSFEFVVAKLKDRGTHQAFGVITNAQDFLHVLRHFVQEAETNLARPMPTPSAGTP
jgi:lysine-ketoglutarate reductase/saccharopine dehydrogenase-like protein (TIGR00300 family)